MSRFILLPVAIVACIAGPAVAQSTKSQSSAAAGNTKPGQATPGTAGATGVTVPPDYKIGVDDVFDVTFWEEPKMSVTDTRVLPDGRITLPLLSDIHAEGLTVDQLQVVITKAALSVLKEPVVNVKVKQINSRKVSITGMVSKPGQYPILGRMTVLELISQAGGVAEFADKKNIRISRIVNGKTESHLFNYKEFTEGNPKALQQNIELRPNDIVTVP